MPTKAVIFSLQQAYLVWAVGTGRAGHYAFTTTVYPDIWVILGDVNQSGQPVYQNVAHEKLVD